MEVQREGKYFKCQFCTVRLDNYQVLCQHLHLCHNVIFLECEFCDCKYLSRIKLKQHIKISHTDGLHPRFECSRCPASFRTESGLKTHTKIIHSAVRPTFACQKCDKVYRSKLTYRKHIQLAHRPLRFVKCDECPKIFYKKQNLKRHKDVNHSANHVRTKCPLCFSTFKYKEHLGRHMQAKHYNKARSACDLTFKSENKCSVCSAQFPDKTTLLQHEKTFHNKGIGIYECEKCTAIFKIREAYEFHVEEEHGMRIDKVKSDSKDFECKDFVDFEETVVNDFELLKLIEYRKSLKPHQRIEILMEDSESDTEDSLLNTEPEELVKITENIHAFFDALCNEYHVPNISENSKTPGNGNERKLDSELDYLVIEIAGQSNDSLAEVNVERGQLNESSIEVKEDSEIEGENTLMINDDSGQIISDVINGVDISGLSAVADDDKENIELINEFEKDEITHENFNHDASSLSSLFVDEVTLEKYENEVTSLPQESYPKISYFHCLECNNQFPKEDLLWTHLTTIHGRTLKSPSTISTTTNSKKEMKIFLNRIDEKSKEIEETREIDTNLLGNDDNLLRPLKQSGPKSIISRTRSKTINKGKQHTLKQKVKKSRIPKKNSASNTKSVAMSMKTTATESIAEGLLQKLPYICDKCNKAFKTKMQLKMHNNRKLCLPFKCNDCDKTFKIKAILVRHEKHHHKKTYEKRINATKETEPNSSVDFGGSMFLCEDCEALFPTTELLHAHRLWEHELNVTLHKCCHCGIIYNQLGDFEKHMETVHNKT